MTVKQFLTKGDYQRELKVQIWDFSKRGGHIIVGEIKTNMMSLISLAKTKNAANLISADANKVVGSIYVPQVAVLEGPSFLDKLERKWRVNLMCGVDCTGLYQKF